MPMKFYDRENELAQLQEIELLEPLMRILANRPFTLILDEFQEFERINSSIFSDIQRVWDLNKESSHLNLLISGSVNSMMHHIFLNEKEPLFSRVGAIINLKPFRCGLKNDALLHNG